MVSAKRKTDDTSDKPAGGPGGARSRASDDADAARDRHDAIEAPSLALDDARALRDIYERGRGDWVQPRYLTLRDVARLNSDGLIDTLQGVRGAHKIRLTARGLSLLPQALKLLAAEPGALR